MSGHLNKVEICSSCNKPVHVEICNFPLDTEPTIGCANNVRWTRFTQHDNVGAVVSTFWLDDNGIRVDVIPAGWQSGECPSAYQIEQVCDVATSLLNLRLGLTTGFTTDDITNPSTVQLTPASSAWSFSNISGTKLSFTTGTSTVTNDVLLATRVQYGTGFQEYGTDTWYDFANEPSGKYEAHVFYITRSGNFYVRTVEIWWDQDARVFERIETGAPVTSWSVKVGSAFQRYSTVTGLPFGSPFRADGSVYPVVGAISIDCPPVLEAESFLTNGDERESAQRLGVDPKDVCIRRVSDNDDWDLWMVTVMNPVTGLLENTFFDWGVNPPVQVPVSDLVMSTLAFGSCCGCGCE